MCGGACFAWCDAGLVVPEASPWRAGPHIETFVWLGGCADEELDVAMVGCPRPRDGGSELFIKSRTCCVKFPMSTSVALSSAGHSYGVSVSVVVDVVVFHYVRPHSDMCRFCSAGYCGMGKPSNSPTAVGNVDGKAGVVFHGRLGFSPTACAT